MWLRSREYFHASVARGLLGVRSILHLLFPQLEDVAPEMALAVDDDESMVFVSSNERTVHFFEKYFLALYESPLAQPLYEVPASAKNLTTSIRSRIAKLAKWFGR